MLRFLLAQLAQQQILHQQVKILTLKASAKLALEFGKKTHLQVITAIALTAGTRTCVTNNNEKNTFNLFRSLHLQPYCQ